MRKRKAKPIHVHQQEDSIFHSVRKPCECGWVFSFMQHYGQSMDVKVRKRFSPARQSSTANKGERFAALTSKLLHLSADHLGHKLHTLYRMSKLMCAEVAAKATVIVNPSCEHHAIEWTNEDFLKYSADRWSVSATN